MSEEPKADEVEEEKIQRLKDAVANTPPGWVATSTPRRPTNFHDQLTREQLRRPIFTSDEEVEFRWTCPKCKTPFKRGADYQIHLESCYGRPPETRGPKWTVQVLLEIEVDEDALTLQKFTDAAHLHDSLQRAIGRKDWTVLSLGGYGYDVIVLDGKIREVGPT